MPISTSGRSSERRPKLATPRGFTLLELSIILLIVAIAASFVIPRLRSTDATALTASAERFASTTRYLYEEAALRHVPMRLNLDFERRVYWVTVLDADPESDEFVPDDSPLSRPVTLPRAVAFRDVVLPRLGTVEEGIVFVQFLPEGYVDPLVVHFETGGGAAATVAVEPLSGRTRVAHEYIDMTDTEAFDARDPGRAGRARPYLRGASSHAHRSTAGSRPRLGGRADASRTARGTRHAPPRP